MKKILVIAMMAVLGTTTSFAGDFGLDMSNGKSKKSSIAVATTKIIVTQRSFNGFDDCPFSGSDCTIEITKDAAFVSNPGSGNPNGGAATFIEIQFTGKLIVTGANGIKREERYNPGKGQMIDLGLVPFSADELGTTEDRVYDMSESRIVGGNKIISINPKRVL